MGSCYICDSLTSYSGGCMGEWECSNPDCKEDGERHKKEKLKDKIKSLEYELYGLRERCKEDTKEKKEFNLKEIVDFAKRNLEDE